jgi:uncharacterized repeat protein (TIGR02543 family)
VKSAVRRTSTALAAVATAGVSTLFVGVAPAAAATEACGDVGTLIAPGLCEQSYTSGSATFIPTAQMTKLEVLLVGAGGMGADQPVPNTNGYAAAGGGGEVKIVDFTGATAPLNLTVPAPGVPGSITDGIVTTAVANGVDGVFQYGGASGSGKAGASGGYPSVAPFYGAGGGAATPATNADGGAGVVVSAIAPAGSLFTGDPRCFGGGGAVGATGIQGIPGCGAGGPIDATGNALSAPAANSGGGGGGTLATQALAVRGGASGVVIIRWSAASITLSFNSGGHGTAPAPQTLVAQTAGVKPADPTADGYEFKGWYTDPQLTTLADFSAPLSASTTLYAKWLPALAATGTEPNPVAFGAAITALAAGTVLIAAARRRKRGAN